MMEKFENIKSIIEDKINHIKTTETYETLLEIDNSYKLKFENMKKDLENYSESQKNNENKLNEIIKLILDLSHVIMLKRELFDSKNIIPNNQNPVNDELKEKIEFEKSQLKLQFLKNNDCYSEMLSTLKTINENIIKIEEDLAEAVAQERFCQEQLIYQEKQIEDLQKLKEQEELATRAVEQLKIQREREAAIAAEIREKEIEKMKEIMIENEKKTSEEKIGLFTTFRYDLRNSEFGDNGLGCYIKLLPNSRIVKADLIIELVDPLQVNCILDGTEEIISNIIKIKSNSENEKFDHPFSVILPHTMSRTQGKEAKIFKYLMDNLSWIPVETQDISMEDSDKSGARFVECIFDILPLVLTVVSIPRVEVFQYGKKGCKWSAMVDNRVNFSVPPGAVKINLSMNITTLGLDSSVIQDIKTKLKGTNADYIHFLTHLIKIKAQKRNLSKPISISLPLPQNQSSKSELCNISMTVFGSNTDSRTKSNFRPQSPEKRVYLFTLDSNRKWVENAEKELEMDDKKDSIKFDIDKISDLTFLGVRAKSEATEEQISKGIEIMMDYLKSRQIKIIVSNHLEDPTLFIVATCLSSRLEKQLKIMNDEGFDDRNAQISSEIEVNECEILTLRFRGNIKLENKPEDYIPKLMYFSQLKSRVKIKLEVVDKYSQRSKARYEGFLTITTSKWMKKPQPRIEGQPRKGPPQMIDVEEIIPIFEAVLSIPKSLEVEANKSRNRDFHFFSKDLVTEDFIKNLSHKVREDWKQLAKALDLPKNRIEQISMKKNNENSTKMAYEVLKMWIMHLPVSKNKEKILNKALDNIGRQDLVEEIEM